jgi:hypothetical protein
MRFGGAILVLTLAACTAPAAQQKPVRDAFETADYGTVPATVAGLARGSAAVIVARYTGESKLTKLYDLVTTTYTFEILEVVKPHQLLPNPTQTIGIRLPGGREEFPTYILRTMLPDTEELVANHHYVVFLHANDVRNELYAGWGPASLYDITGVNVQALDRTRAAHDAESVTGFLAALQSQ